MKKFMTLIMLPATLLISSCASEIGANRYETSAVGQVNTAREGVIISVRRVRVATSDGTVGTLGGAVAGGALGSLIGGSDAVRVAAAAGGAILGGVAGQSAQEALSSQDGYEYVIKMNDGGALTVTQGADVVIAVGQRVMVLNASRGERARVIPF